MKVMVFVKATHDSEAGAMPSVEMLAAMGKFNDELANAGILLDAAGLTATARGARVHFSGANRMVTRGPFTETNELVAGFWIWQVKSLDEAIEWVKKCPNPMPVDSDIEIRPFMEMEEFSEILTPELQEQYAGTDAKAKGLQVPAFREGRRLTLAGINRRYSLQTRINIPQQWEAFVPQAAPLLKHPGADHFGVCWNRTAEGEFDYLTGVEVSTGQTLPPGFQTLTVEPRRYVVFTHSGHVSALDQTIDTICGKWAPDCGLKLAASAPLFERYSSKFDPTTGLGGMEIWVPLES